MAKEGIVIGIILALIGIFLLILNNTVSIIYGIILLAAGTAIAILNKEEDKVEERKDINTKKTKK